MAVTEAVRPGDGCGDTTFAGRWGGQASNLRPTDYESAALTD